MTLLLLNIPFNDIFHDYFLYLRLFLILLQQSLFTLLLWHLLPSLLPSINLRGKTTFYGHNGFNIVTWDRWVYRKILYLNSFVIFARVHPIPYCSNVKTGTQHVGQYVATETGWRDSSRVRCGVFVVPRSHANPAVTTHFCAGTCSDCVPRQRGKPPCKTQLIQRDTSRTESSSHRVPQKSWWYMSEEEFLCGVETAPGKSLPALHKGPFMVLWRRPGQKNYQKESGKWKALFWLSR